MDVKQEPFDPFEDVVKTEQNVSCRMEDNYLWSTKQQNKQYINVGEIKQETVDCGVSEIACMPTKTECNSIQFVTIKKDLGDTKEEVSEYVHKIEDELLTTYCDLPTLKSEVIDYPDYFVEPCNSKYAEKTFQVLNTTTNVSKKRKKPYSCLVCQKNFYSSKSRLKHIDGHFGKNFVICEFCGKFMTKNDYFRHYFIHQVKKSTRKVFQKINNLYYKKFKKTSIEDADDKLFKCDICSKRFNYKSVLHTHLLVHTNAKPFKCYICSKGYKRKSRLTRHLIIHNGEKTI